MIKIWDIKLYQKKTGKFKVLIESESGKKVVGHGATPHMAYKDAETKLIIKPWLTSEEVKKRPSQYM
jgi:hypothetical protein